jgi:hypothetical protein
LSAAPQNDVSIVFDDRPIHDRHGETAPMTPKPRGKSQAARRFDELDEDERHRACGGIPFGAVVWTGFVNVP